MTRLDGACYWVSLVSAIFLWHSYNTSVAYDRPVHTVVAALAACAFAILSCSEALPDLFHLPNSKSVYSALPLDDLSAPIGISQIPPTQTSLPAQNGLVRFSVVAVASLALSIRVELYRRISKATECSTYSLEIWLPLLIVAYDCVRFQRYSQFHVIEFPRNKIYAFAQTTINRYILQPRSRYILSTYLLCYGTYLLLGLWSPLNSAYICPIVLKQQITIPLMQAASLLLDFILAVVAFETSPRPDGTGLSPRRIAVLWSSSMSGAVLVWSLAGFIVYTFKPEYRFWLLLFDVPSTFASVLAIGWQAILFSAFCISTLHSTMIYGVLSVAMVLVAILTLLPSLKIIWLLTNPFPPASAWTTTIAFVLIYVGWWSFHRIRQLPTLGEDKQASSQKLLLFVAFVLLLPTWLKKSSSHYHPIDLLIYDAKLQHDTYVSSLKHNGSLNDTVANYKARYKRNPPPGFDVWFEYAMNRSTLIIDEYDQIYEDLLPFFALSPSSLRRRTWEMVSNPWNEIAWITIRNGIAAVQESAHPPTHHWMLEGIVVLINSFAQYLPDMDLAFNLNDESRVAVPYETLSNLREQGRLQAILGQKPFSDKRANDWKPISREEYHDTVFHDLSFRNTFARFGSVGCPPSSASRRYQHISSQSTICSSCVAPHSLGQFVSNWTLATDICHQPDMAHLHGFYLSPAAFKTSYDLMPVFSQSKAHAYNDILYPTAWNYMDKVKYDPSQPIGSMGREGFKPGFPDLPFTQKKNTLFWRGATSEGVSAGDHAWRGMTRQRLVHLANNLTSSSHDKITILLPDSSVPGNFRYQLISGPAIKELGLSTDIAIVDRIDRCGGIGLHDCTDQANEFNLVPPADFQSHWAYRYLFDCDGAAFSGRFLAFLHSRSLPFKTGLFRQWYDSRLTAWRHFVPQDTRLHGMWSTLAYFAGVNGVLNGRRLTWDGHINEGEMIAEAGREWAAKVLRKEDMELYFFRLLLEWGRLTDDNRDNLGFVLQ